MQNYPAWPAHIEALLLLLSAAQGNLKVLSPCQHQRSTRQGKVHLAEREKESTQKHSYLKCTHRARAYSGSEVLWFYPAAKRNATLYKCRQRQQSERRKTTFCLFRDRVSRRSGISCYSRTTCISHQQHLLQQRFPSFDRGNEICRLTEDLQTSVHQEPKGRGPNCSKPWWVGEAKGVS